MFTRPKKKYVYRIQVHSLSPWPANYSALQIYWKRGGTKHGLTKPSGGPAVEERGARYGTYEFDAAFYVPCTLFSGKGGGGAEDKWLVLSILTASPLSDRKGDELGHVLVNLANFAAEEGFEARQAFSVASKRAISAAVGEAKLHLTIGCVSKKQAAQHYGSHTMQRMGSGMDSASESSSSAAVSYTTSHSSQQATSLPQVPVRRTEDIPAPINPYRGTPSHRAALTAPQSDEYASRSRSDRRRTPGADAGDQRRSGGEEAQGSEDEDDLALAEGIRYVQGLHSQPGRSQQLTGQPEDPLTSQNTGSAPSMRALPAPTHPDAPVVSKENGPPASRTPAPEGSAATKATINGEEHALISGRKQPWQSSSSEPAQISSSIGANEGAQAGFESQPPLGMETRQVEPGPASLPSGPVADLAAPLIGQTSQHDPSTPPLPEPPTPMPAEEAHLPAPTPTAARDPATPAMGTAKSAADAEMLEALQHELLTVAALEASVYLARAEPCPSEGARLRRCQAPARRLARTIISLGPAEGIVFGLRAIRSLEAMAQACGDVLGRAFWWSNCLQLRWMLWAMSQGVAEDEVELAAGGGPGEDQGLPGDSFAWVMQVLVPPLRELEGVMFESMAGYLWHDMLVEALLLGSPDGADLAVPSARSLDNFTSSPLAAEAVYDTQLSRAVACWTSALQAVHRMLQPLSASTAAGHLPLLIQRALSTILLRLDALFFHHLLAGGEELPASLDPGQAPTPGQGGARSSRAALQQSLLRLLRTPLPAALQPWPASTRLSFGVGVGIKMAITTWAQWAADAGWGATSRPGSATDEGDSWALFPKLRATADLLMMPKQALVDPDMRADVLPGLTLHEITCILSRFQEDDFAKEPLPPGLMDALACETPREALPDGAASPQATLAAYQPPSERTLLSDNLIEPVSLEMDAESEDELEDLVELFDPSHSDEGVARFALLRDLWSCRAA